MKLSRFRAHWMAVTGTLVAGLLVLLSVRHVQKSMEGPPVSRMEMFLRQELPGAKEVVLYSLDPCDWSRYQAVLAGPPYLGPRLGRWRILGELELKTAKERDLAVSGLVESMRGASELRYLCFNPRHGLRLVTREGREAVFVLCFECNAVSAEGLPHGEDGGFLGDAGLARINRLLDKHGITRDKPEES